MYPLMMPMAFGEDQIFEALHNNAYDIEKVTTISILPSPSSKLTTFHYHRHMRHLFQHGIYIIRYSMILKSCGLRKKLKICVMVSNDLVKNCVLFKNIILSNHG